jgi:hypothetical protein
MGHAVIRKVNCAGLEFQLSPGTRLIDINNICRRFGDKTCDRRAGGSQAVKSGWSCYQVQSSTYHRCPTLKLTMTFSALILTHTFETPFYYYVAQDRT